MSNTALSYQMMIEEKLMTAAIHAEQRNQYMIAAYYLKTHAEFLGVDKDKLPNPPVGKFEHMTEHTKWLDYYFKILNLIGDKMKLNLIDVRRRYNTKTVDLPVTN